MPAPKGSGSDVSTQERCSDVPDVTSKSAGPIQLHSSDEKNVITSAQSNVRLHGTINVSDACVNVSGHSNAGLKSPSYHLHTVASTPFRQTISKALSQNGVATTDAGLKTSALNFKTTDGDKTLKTYDSTVKPTTFIGQSNDLQTKEAVTGHFLAQVL